MAACQADEEKRGLSLILGSVGLGARFLDRAAPLLDLAAQERRELARGVGLPFEAELRETLAHIGREERAVDLGVEAIREILRHARGREERRPGEVIEA